MDEVSPTGVRVFLVDDHPVLRNGLSLLLTQSGHAVCGEAGSRAVLLAAIDGSRADVALVDLSLAEESGLDLMDDLTARGVAPVIYSMHEDRKTIERSFRCGAAGYVTKREVADVLLAALGEVLAGRRYARPRATNSLASQFLVPDEEAEAALSQREEQIIARLARADTSDEIAEALHISSHTVKTYYSRIIEKLGLDGMKGLRKLAAQRYK